MPESKRITRVFWIYGEALAAAKSTIKQLANGNAVATSLSKADAQACQFALSKLRTLASDLNALFERACKGDL